MTTNNFLDSLYLAAHSYPGGVPALAVRMACNSTVLSHRLNPNDSAHNLTALQAVQIVHMTNNLAPLHALCMEFGHMALPIPSIADGDATAEALTSVCKEFADFLQRTTEAISDRKVTRLELREIRKELCELIASAGRLEAIAATMEAKRGK